MGIVPSGRRGGIGGREDGGGSRGIKKGVSGGPREGGAGGMLGVMPLKEELHRDAATEAVFVVAPDCPLFGCFVFWFAVRCI